MLIFNFTSPLEGRVILKCNGIPDPGPLVPYFFFTLCDTFFKWKGIEEQEHHLLVYAFGINKRYFHLLKVFAILVFFQIPPCIAYIHIVHKENRGMLNVCLPLIILLCFFVMPKNIFMGNEFFLLLVNASKLLGNCPLCVYKIAYEFWEDTKRIRN